MMAMDSLVWVHLWGKSPPMAALSSGCQPAPAPRMNRPPE